MTHRISSLALSKRDEPLLLDDFSLTRTFRAAGLTLKVHAHKYTNVSFCVSGQFQETLRESWHDVTPATLICRPSGEPHENRYAHHAARCLIFEVLPRGLERIRCVTTLLDQSVLLRAEVVAAFSARIDREFRTRDSLSVLSIESLLYELIVYAARQKADVHDRLPKWLLRVRDLLNDCFLSPLTMSQIANTAAVHPAHLSRAFRKHFHQTPGEYVRDLRAMRAVELLKRDLPLAEIAISCGFYDQSHFSRAFKRRFGLSPARFRSSLIHV